MRERAYYVKGMGRGRGHAVKGMGMGQENAVKGMTGRAYASWERRSAGARGGGAI